MIIKNKARCKLCKDIIESKDRWDFKWCKCGAIAVDGGTFYIKRVGKKQHIEDLSEEK